MIGPVVRSLAIGSQDNVWVATSEGVSKLSGVVGINDRLYNKDLKIYPNPSSSMVNIEYPTINNQSLELYNGNFQLIKKQLINNNRTTISVDEFENGIYFLKINESVKKLIIQH